MPVEDNLIHNTELYPKVFPKANWSVVFQVAAESDLVIDMMEIYNRIARVGSTMGKMNFIVVYDGLQVEGLPIPDNPAVYYVRQSVSFDKEAGKPVIQYPKDNLTDPDIFSALMSAVKTRFPADHWAYFYCGHGAPGGTNITNGKFLVKLDRELFIKGELETDDHLTKRLIETYEKDGWLFDDKLKLTTEVNGHNILVILRRKGESKDLSYFELGRFLSTVFEKNELEFICLDSCWGQLTENNQAFKGITNYLVASVDEMPVHGIGYEGFCRVLADNPGIAPFELASVITSTFYQSNYNDYLSSPAFNGMGVSISCVSLANYEKFFLPAFNELTSYMIDGMPAFLKDITLARNLCKDHTYSAPDEYNAFNIDLLWFLENLIHFTKDLVLITLCQRVITSIKLHTLKAFIANNYAETEPGQKEPALGGHGYTISFPCKQTEYDDSIYSDEVKGAQAHLHKSWLWKEFLQLYIRASEKAEAAHATIIKASLESTFDVIANGHGIVAVEETSSLVAGSINGVPETIPSNSRNKWRKA